MGTVTGLGLSDGVLTENVRGWETVMRDGGVGRGCRRILGVCHLREEVGMGKSDSVHHERCEGAK